MAKIHMTLQGKGGASKSWSATMLAQYKIHKGHKPVCVDLDPVNATFAAVKALKVKRIEVAVGDIENGFSIDPRRFDALIELIANTKDDAIIDNGSSAFVQMTHYLISNQIPSLLRDMGHELVLHTPIIGGEALLNTVGGFADLARQFPWSDAGGNQLTKFVVWLNPYFGPIAADDGRGFQELKAYVENKDAVSGIVTVPDFAKDTFGKDFAEVLAARQTFQEAIEDKSKLIVVKQRLKIIRDRIFAQLDLNAGVL